MSLTIPQLLDTSFGYLTGADLAAWCSPQLLIKQYLIDAKSLARGCNTAYAEAAAALRTRYSTSAELAKIMFTQAKATASITAGAVTGFIILNGGSNYISEPAVVFSGGGGAGAEATPILTNGVVTGFTIIAPGVGYTSSPTVEITGGMGSDMRESLLVKIISILAVRNTLGSFENIGEGMFHHFEKADRTLRDIRNGQENLVLPSTLLYTSEQLQQLYPTIPANPLSGGCDAGGNQPIQTGPGSIARMVPQSFGTLG